MWNRFLICKFLWVVFGALAKVSGSDLRENRLVSG